MVLDADLCSILSLSAIDKIKINERLSLQRDLHILSPNHQQLKPCSKIALNQEVSSSNNWCS